MSSFYFRVIVGWLVIDTTTTLIHNIEKALNRKCIVTVITFDIKGVLDRVIEK